MVMKEGSVKYTISFKIKQRLSLYKFLTHEFQFIVLVVIVRTWCVCGRYVNDTFSMNI